MERVLVVESARVVEMLGGRTGLIEMDEGEALSILERAFFLDRSVAEHDERYRQVIPYVVFSDNKKVLLVRRTKKQSEKRLHDMYSIGIGGHVNEKDGENPIEAFRNGMMREIDEEIDVHVEKIEFIGLINSLENEVSRVHLGFLYIAFGKFHDVRERDNFEWMLAELGDLDKYREMMEGWSRIALDGLRSHLSRS